MACCATPSFHLRGLVPHAEGQGEGYAEAASGEILSRRWLPSRSRQSVSHSEGQRSRGRNQDLSTAALWSRGQEEWDGLVPATCPWALSTPRRRGFAGTRRQVTQLAARSKDRLTGNHSDEDEPLSAEAIDEIFGAAAEDFLRISRLEYNSRFDSPPPKALLNDEDSPREQAAGGWDAGFQDDEGEEGEILGDVGYSDDEDTDGVSPPDERSWDTVFSGADPARLGPRQSTGLLEDSFPLPLQSKALGWCGLCGKRTGWLDCGACGGIGAYPTKPGLGGKSGVVGLARCKTCYGWRKVPCILCGVKGRKEWAQWQEGVRRRPKKLNPLGPGPG